MIRYKPPPFKPAPGTPEAASKLDARYVFAAVGLLASAHYMLGYEALVLAPGINPVLHFLDLPVLLVCLRFFRTGRLAPLALGVLGAAAALATNGLFGAMVAAAFCAEVSTHSATSRRSTG